MGKYSVAQVAFGKSIEDEFKDNLHHLSKVVNVKASEDWRLNNVNIFFQRLSGDTGILFTSRSKKEVLRYCRRFLKY